jgi:hypothetical protein
MYYTKGSVVGYSGKGKFLNKVITIKFECLMADHDLEKLLEPIREQFNELGDKLDFKMTLQSEDI